MARKKGEQNGTVAEQQEPPQEAKKPVGTFKAPVQGGRIEVAVWENTLQTERGEVSVFSTTITRSYKRDEEWKETHSMRAGDLPALCVLLQRAYTYCLDIRQES